MHHLVEEHADGALLLRVLFMINWPHTIVVRAVVKFGVTLANTIADGQRWHLPDVIVHKRLFTVRLLLLNDIESCDWTSLRWSLNKLLMDLLKGNTSIRDFSPEKVHIRVWHLPVINPDLVVIFPVLLMQLFLKNITSRIEFSFLCFKELFIFFKINVLSVFDRLHVRKEHSFRTIILFLHLFGITHSLFEFLEINQLKEIFNRGLVLLLV